MLSCWVLARLGESVAPSRQGSFANGGIFVKTKAILIILIIIIIIIIIMIMILMIMNVIGNYLSL